MTKHKKFIWLTSILAIAGLAFYFTTQNNPQAKGGKQFGGELHLAIKSKHTDLNPLVSNTLDHHRVQQLIFEPLILPAANQRGWNYLLAKKITVLSDKKTVRISLRKNIRFAPDPCFRLASDELTAADVAFSLSLACANTKLIEQSNYFAGLIVGGAAFYQNQENPFLKRVKGIRVIDDYLLEIKLTAPYNHFIQILGSPGFGMMSLQAAKYYKSRFFKQPVGTGPFQLQHSDKHIAEFRSNKNYWRKDVYGNQLPYTDKVIVKYGVSGAEAQQLFLQNQLDLLFDLPIDDLQEAFGTLNDAKSGKNPLHEVYIKNTAKIHFLQFDCTKKPFDDPVLRKAFALAIDTKTICEEMLKGEGLPLNGYFIPTTQGGLNAQKENPAQSFDERVFEAQRTLAQAGYNSKNPLPTIYLYVGAAKNTLAYRWSDAVAQMLRQNLGVKISMKTEELKGSSKNALWRSGWIGDYAGAESYLRLFYSGAQKPVFFKNRIVDALYLNAVLAQKEKEKQKAERLCEKEIMKQNAFLPIYTEGFILLNQLHLRGLVLNQVGLIDYAQLYIKELKTN